MIAFMYDSETAEATERILRSVAITGKYMGFWYLVASVDIVLRDPEMLSFVTKGIYRELAKRFDTTVGAVERNIRTAAQGGWDKMGADGFLPLLGYRPKSCPSNVELIESLVYHARRG